MARHPARLRRPAQITYLVNPNLSARDLYDMSRAESCISVFDEQGRFHHGSRRNGIRRHQARSFASREATEGSRRSRCASTREVVMEKRPSGFFNHITFTYHFYFPAHLVALSTFCPRAKQCLNCTSHSHRAKCSKRPSGVNEKRDTENRFVPVDRAYNTILLLHVWSV